MTAEATLKVAGDTPILELGHFQGLTLVGLVRVIPAHHILRKIPKHLLSTLGKLPYSRMCPAALSTFQRVSKYVLGFVGCNTVQ
jgi:hypothetical protein